MDPESLSEDYRVVLGMLLAAAIGFLVGRTREEASQAPRLPKPGIRDFVILALTGAICACLENTALTVAVLVAACAFLFLMRMQQPGRHGVTTELAALSTFLLGYLCLTEWRTLAALLGIVLALLLANKEELKGFSLRKISEREFGDTLKFLALIFVIYPILPEGGYGPFQFFEPRKIWFFVILVSAVSYVGYFLGKFFDARKGIYLTALVGGLASTTAYTGGVSKAVAESPQMAVAWARAVLLANSVLFPRLLLIAAAFSPELAQVAFPPLAAMTVAGLLAAWLLCRDGGQKQASSPMSGFKNPFTFGPALKFGLVFMGVIFLARAGKHYLGDGGQWIMAAIGGLIDVDAVLLAQAEFVKSGSSLAEEVVPLIVLAAGANAVFKAVLAWGSRESLFYKRVWFGFALIFLAGAGVTVFIWFR